ncbi:hypothetical protein GQ44DRAFT_623802 [Phaeosphaeriaceae sp. PMI808]|nr:hypothetical protein GQ44DRAFT_623802 [Phaeosphaeriaceae sp. PMI808]
MTNQATITFSQTGVQPPVYVVTSLSDPPWETLEMDVDTEQTVPENFVFMRHFHNVKEGSYQYKVRVGDGHWVVDESKDSATDEHGNRNNVIHVKATSNAELPKSAPKNTNEKKLEDSRPQGQTSSSSQDLSKDNIPRTNDATQLEKAAEKNLEHAEHPPWSSIETAEGETLVASEPVKSLDVAQVVVEKTDDRLLHGDDFGDDATTAQKVVYGLRAADTVPDKLVITPEDNERPITDDDDQSNSEGFVTTPSDSGELLNNDELVHKLLMSHEVDTQEPYSELGNGNLLPHELGPEEEDVEDFDELDAAPLLSHETGLSSYHDGGAMSNNGIMSGDAADPRHYTHDYNYANDDDDCNEGPDTPLLPHERESAIIDHSSSDDGSYALPRQPTFGYETDHARGLFGGNEGPQIFRMRTNSSTLPHRLPKSDADDENLSDPSLERFPTNREQILERVASISLHLPEDEAVENDTIHSPVVSVLSQACSSVDLAPVKSYASLASVPEALDSDEEEEGDDDDDDGGDMDSLPSPLVMHMGGAATSFARDPHRTPLPSDTERFELSDITTPQAQSSQEAQSRDENSIGEDIGTKDTILSRLRDGIATPNSVLNCSTPDKESTSLSNDNAAPEAESQARQRQVSKEDDPQTTPSPAVDPNGQDMITRTR